jgi:hypothetical protein
MDKGNDCSKDFFKGISESSTKDSITTLKDINGGIVKTLEELEKIVQPFSKHCRMQSQLQ